MAGSSACGQSTAANGFLTTYTYYPGGKLQSITQNPNGSQKQIRSFTYDNVNTGRPLTVTTPESGTSTTTYDSDPAHACVTFTEFPVKTVDNAGGISCFQYDLADRLTSVSFSGFNGAVTPTKTFVYDASTNPAFTCAAVNGAGQIVEASTSSASALLTDEGFCYDRDGRPTDSFLWTSTGNNAYGHITEQYFANGAPQTISWIGGWPSPIPPTVTYTLDPMGRAYSASDSNSNTLVTSTSYYLDNAVNTVVFGNGDQSAYTEYANFAPNTVTHTIGTATNNTIAYTPVWNSNGTLQSLQTVDKFAGAANSKTCAFSYDDLVRISTDNCGSAWNESFTYDLFGNITKAGSLIWPPPGVTYAGSNNRYYEASGNPFSYDGNGRLLADTFDALSWDVNGNMLSQTGTTFSYDAVDRPVTAASAGVRTSYVYAPDGSMIASIQGTTSPVWRMLIGLPASRVVYNKQSGLISPFYIERDDWQSSVRVSSTWTNIGRHTDVAYDAFGVPYWSSATTDNQFSGLNTDVSSGTELVSESRRYHPSQGRWESPDDGIPDLYNPQSFNAYHYSLNMPTTVTDPDGQDEMDGAGGTPCPMCNLVFDPAYAYEIDQQYFASISNLAALYQSSGIGGALYPQAIAQKMAQNDINIVANQSGGLASTAMSIISDEFGGMAKQVFNTIPDMANSINRPLDSFLSNFTSFRFGEVPAL
jgi:RHS repeat-associated protein